MQRNKTKRKLKVSDPSVAMTSLIYRWTTPNMTIKLGYLSNVIRLLLAVWGGFSPKLVHDKSWVCVPFKDKQMTGT